MSADNTIVVLGTLAANVKAREPIVGKRVYRVSHVQAWDSFQWYQDNAPDEIEDYLHDVFDGCKPYLSREAAMEKALNLADDLAKQGLPLEYGIICKDVDIVF